VRLLAIPIKQIYDGNNFCFWRAAKPANAETMYVSGQIRAPGNRPDDFPAQDD
jgi:hypothetical protein